MRYMLGYHPLLSVISPPDYGLGCPTTQLLVAAAAQTPAAAAAGTALAVATVLRADNRRQAPGLTVLKRALPASVLSAGSRKHK